MQLVHGGGSAPAQESDNEMCSEGEELEGWATGHGLNCLDITSTQDQVQVSTWDCQ